MDQPSAGAAQAQLTLKVALALAATVLMFGSGFVAIRAAVGDYGAVNIALLRYLAAAVALVGVGLARRVPWPRPRVAGAAVLIGALLALYSVLLGAGQRTVTASAASFLVATVPIFTSLLAITFLGERVSRAAWIGVGICFSGVTLISLGGGGRLTWSPGATLVLVAALTQATYVTLQKRALRGVRAFDLTLYSSVAAGLLLLPFCGGLWPELRVASPASTWALVYLGVFPTGAAVVTWSYALHHLPASRAAAFLYAVPAATLVIGMVWLREIPTAMVLVGGTLTMIGVLFTAWLSRVKPIRP